MFWQMEQETLKRAKLEALQLKRLKQTLKRVYDNVPFYQKAFTRCKVKPVSLKSVKDIEKFPFTTREDLQANYPDGLLACGREDIVRLHTSSGTTGKPKAVFFTKADLDNSANLIARCLVATGCTKHDVLQNMMSYGLFTGGLVMHYGAEKLGMLIIPSAVGNTDRQIMLMQDFGTTTLHLTPSYALYLASHFEAKGINPAKDLKLKRAFMGAEPYTEETRLKLESSMGIEVFNSYGLTEMNGPGVAFECTEKNGMHIWEDNFIVEIVDPATGKQLPDGEYGELVLTTINREGMPIIRYRTRDITAIDPVRCACGRTHVRIKRIHGRADDMFIIRGVNIYPQQIEQVLMGVNGVGKNYQIVLESSEDMTIRVEFSKGYFDGNLDNLKTLRGTLVEKLKAAILVRPKVELAEPGTLPVSEGKSKRVIDNRKVY